MSAPLDCHRASVDHGTSYIFQKLWPTAFRFLLGGQNIDPYFSFGLNQKSVWIWIKSQFWSSADFDFRFSFKFHSSCFNLSQQNWSLLSLGGFWVAVNNNHLDLNFYLDLDSDFLSIKHCGFKIHKSSLLRWWAGVVSNVQQELNFDLNFSSNFWSISHHYLEFTKKPKMKTSEVVVQVWAAMFSRNVSTTRKSILI